ncbi:choline transport protein, partial [Mycena galericulata]
SIAELASSIPSAGGVYHWATVAGGKYGRVLGFFAGDPGLLNFYGWKFGFSAILVIPANVAIQMYVVFHPEFLVQAWHTYLALVLVTWLCCLTVISFNRFMPLIQRVGLFLIVVGGVITVVVRLGGVEIARLLRSPIFTHWQNETGWFGGVAFLTGIWNGAFAIGTPDSVTHIAEELPHPRRDLPRAIAAQIIIGALTGFVYVVALMFSITDLDAVLTSNGSFPLAVVYSQATGNKAGTFGLLFIVFVCILTCCIGIYITLGRTWWALARDNVTPFAFFFSHASQRLSCPVPATLFCAFLGTSLGAIQLGSKTAFADLSGSFVILTTTSYGLAILLHLMSGRKIVPRGPFWMGGPVGFAVKSISVLLIVFTNVMFCFLYALPATLPEGFFSMNYNSVILVGCGALTAIWWIAHGRRRYRGPCLPHLARGAGCEITNDI